MNIFCSIQLYKHKNMKKKEKNITCGIRIRSALTLLFMKLSLENCSGALANSATIFGKDKSNRFEGAGQKWQKRSSDVYYFLLFFIVCVFATVKVQLVFFTPLTCKLL